MAYEYNTLYQFNTKLITSLKMKSNILTRADFVKMKSVAPDSYDLACDSFRFKTEKQLSKNMKIALEKDTKILKSSGLPISEYEIESQKSNIFKNVLSTISNKSMFILEKTKRSFMDAAQFPLYASLGLTTAVTMITYSKFLTSSQIFNLKESKQEHIMNDVCDLELVNEDLGLSAVALAAVGMLYLKASIAYSFGVDAKRRNEVVKTALPGATTMFTLPIVLAMCAANM